MPDLNPEKKKSFTVNNTSAAKKKQKDEEEVKPFGERLSDWIAAKKVGCVESWEGCKEYSHNVKTNEDGTEEHIYCNNNSNNWSTYYYFFVIL